MFGHGSAWQALIINAGCCKGPRVNPEKMHARAQLLRVPEVLPPAAGGARPVPSFAGVAVLPLKRSLYASTLSQLSALSASFGPASLAQPQVQACART